MIWTMLDTTAAPAESGGVCCPAGPGRTRRGARPSAAAARRARPCTCPCRRAWWSPRSTTRWRGAASAATASTCRDVRPPALATRTDRPRAPVAPAGRTPGEEVARGTPVASSHRPQRAATAPAPPAYVRTARRTGARTVSGHT